jgi:hypothetical protein
MYKRTDMFKRLGSLDYRASVQRWLDSNETEDMICLCIYMYRYIHAFIYNHLFVGDKIDLRTGLIYKRRQI